MRFLTSFDLTAYGFDFRVCMLLFYFLNVCLCLNSLINSEDILLNVEYCDVLCDRALK